MRLASLFVCLGMLGAMSAEAQLFHKKNEEEIFETPKMRIDKILKHTQTEEEYQSHMWNFARDTMSSDVKIRKNIVQSEETPFWSRYSVWADATGPARMAEFGTGKYAHEALARPTGEDRRAASQMPETSYPGEAENNDIMAAVYRHFFGYRAKGFGLAAHRENAKLKFPPKDVYFIGLGPHIVDLPPSFLAALQGDPELKHDGIVLRPISKLLEVTDEAIRDRDTGAFGPAFRIDEIGLVKDGEVSVTATFTEREGFWFTRELTLRQDEKAGWIVANDTDYPTR